MKRSILLFMLFLTNPFSTFCSEAQSATMAPQVTEIKPINKKLELFKAIKNGITGIVACTASFYIALIIKHDLKRQKEPKQQVPRAVSSLFIGLDIFTALALLDIGYSKLALAVESLKQLTVHSSAALPNSNSLPLPTNVT